MKLTGRQQRELEVLKFFVPSEMKSVEITDQDIKEYFDYSDKGVKSERYRKGFMTKKDRYDGLDCLIWGKSRRDYQTKEWVRDIHEGIIFVWELVDELPDTVIDLMKKILPIKAWDTWREKKKTPLKGRYESL